MNIAIIEGKEASQYGIGVVCARIAASVLRNAGLAVPVGTCNETHGPTLSVPGVISSRGLREFYPPLLSEEERGQLDRGVTALKKA